MKNRLLELLNIRKDEAWLVLNLFCLKSFQGFGVAVFNVVAFTLFLEKFQAKSLPSVYIAAALLLWLAGYLYSKAEHALHVKKLALIVIIIVAFSILAFRLQFYFFSDANNLIFFMAVCFYVLYLLDNLEFWGIAALLFDIRQSKRMFGLLGAVDLPAKLIGYAMVPVLIEFMNIENLLYLSFAAVLASLFFYFRLRRAGKLDIHIKHDEHEHEHEEKHRHFTVSVGSIIKSLFTNRMITLVAGLSFIVVCCVTLISFYFYAEVKHKSHNDRQLADFISIFYALGGIGAIIIRSIVTGRLSNFLGTKNSLFISPAILFSMLLGILFIPMITDNEFFILYAFGSMAILAEVLKTALQDPSLYSLMQTLSFHMRLRGHTIVKGVMDPFGMAFSGLILMGLLGLTQSVEQMLRPLCFTLIGLLGSWVVMIHIVYSEYVRSLVTALHKRYSVGREIDLTDEQTLRVLETKMSKGSSGDAIYILNLIEQKYTGDKERFVLKAMKHPHKEVRMEAIRIAERKRIYSALPVIEEIIASRSDIEILPEAVKAKCILLPDELEEIEEFLDNDDSRLVKSAIAGSMISGGISAVVVAGQKLLNLIASPAFSDRVMAAQIIGELEVHSFYKPLLALLNDENEEVVKAAVIAAGKVKNIKLVTPLLQMFIEKKHMRLVLNALQETGDLALADIKKAILSDAISKPQQFKLIQVCGSIGTPNAAVLLDELTDKLPVMHAHIFHSLHLCKFIANPANKARYEKLIGWYLESAVRILFMVEVMHNIKTAKILTDALYIEINRIRDSIMLLFTFLYDQEKIIKTKTAFQYNRKESIANGLEMIDVAVPKEFSLKFIRLFEPADLKVKCNSLRSGYKDELSYPIIIEEILDDKHYNYHRWTKATALHSVIFYKGHEKRKWLEKAGNEKDFLISEIAEKTLSEMN